MPELSRARRKVAAAYCPADVLARRARNGLCLAAPAFLGGCARLEGIEPDVRITPAQWLASHPHLRLPIGDDGLVVMEPSSSLLVFGLAALAVAVGLNVWRSRGPHRSRRWWAIALVLWGIGAFVAGTSYQAFSYEIKARGREFVAWTSAWEVAYLLLSVASVNAMVAAVAYGSALGRARRSLLAYAVVCSVAYAVCWATGIWRPVRFLVSFELLVLVTTPGYVACFLLNARAWHRSRQRLERRLMTSWVALGGIMAAHFAYGAAGIGDALWQRGLWFTANDLLHLGLIGWMLWLHRAVLPSVHDVAREGLVPGAERRGT